MSHRVNALLRFCPGKRFDAPARKVDMTKTSVVTFIAAALLFARLSPADCFAYQKGKKSLASRSVSGTYKYVLNTLEVLELPDHQVRISFSGFWPNDRKRADTRNVGNFDETVRLTGRTAVVKPEYGDDQCNIALEFKSNRVAVTQEGYHCGFGFNVEADGTYSKVSSKPPALPPLEKRQ
jgi:hypothetical protein